MELKELSPDSRVWIYKSNRPISEEEQSQITNELNAFIPTWAAHGNELFGAAEIVKDWFVVLAVDESKSYASGFSIDSSVQVIKSLGAKLNIDFFDRMHVLIERDDKLENVHFSNLAKYPESRVYNPLIEKLGDYLSNWLVKVNESSFI